MDENKEKWIDSVLASMEGKVPVEPRPDLLDDIRRAIEPKSRLRVIHLQVASVAASLILLLNIMLFQQLSEQGEPLDTDIAAVNYDLVNDFNVFEYD